MRTRSTLLTVAAAGAIALSGCGGDDVAGKVRRQGQDLQQRARDLQERARDLEQKVRRMQEDVASGKLDPQEATRQLQEEARKLHRQSLEAAKESIDELDGKLPGAARERLEDARREIEAALE